MQQIATKIQQRPKVKKLEKQMSAIVTDYS
jgi:hypothetical protein